MCRRTEREQGVQTLSREPGSWLGQGLRRGMLLRLLSCEHGRWEDGGRLPEPPAAVRSHGLRGDGAMSGAETGSRLMVNGAAVEEWRSSAHM
jgi:hypothetical protein